MIARTNITRPAHTRFNSDTPRPAKKIAATASEIASAASNPENVYRVNQLTAPRFADKYYAAVRFVGGNSCNMNKAAADSRMKWFSGGGVNAMYRLSGSAWMIVGITFR